MGARRRSWKHVTDAYIDRLIDKETFEERKAALLLERGRELSGAVRKSETETLRHPVVPVADGFLGGFVRVDGFATWR